MVTLVLLRMDKFDHLCLICIKTKTHCLVLREAVVFKFKLLFHGYVQVLLNGVVMIENFYISPVGSSFQQARTSYNILPQMGIPIGNSLSTLEISILPDTLLTHLASIPQVLHKLEKNEIRYSVFFNKRRYLFFSVRCFI